MKYGKVILVVLALALIAVWGCERKVVNEYTNTTDAAGCVNSCHNDSDGALQQAEGEWQNSIHASGNNIDYTNRGGGSDCTKCHDHQGFLDFLATGTVSAPYSKVSAIGCFTCHAPHSTFTLELRTVAPYTMPAGNVFDHGNGNLCVNCHHVRDKASTIVAATDSFTIDTRWGPHHGAQGEMVSGTGGYLFAGYTYDSDPHASVVREACAGCHMGNVQTHDGYDVGGHSFNMRALEDSTITMVKYCSSDSIGCHVTKWTNFDMLEDSVDYDGDGELEGCQSETHGMLDSLEALLISRGLLTLQQGSYLPAKQKKVLKDEAGAVYNFLLIEEDRSFGVHNFAYMAGLLQSSIEYIESTMPTSSRPDENQLYSSH
ncbi:MAG: hypothetical protein AB1644_08335 [Candidatus Zixiibacteriota bacterium]